MNDILIEQLKEAKFPFKNYGSGFDKDFKIIKRPIIELSELIEASKMHELKQGLDDMWRAWGSYGYGSREGVGSTPEEAVARLWLELNK